MIELTEDFAITTKERSAMEMDPLLKASNANMKQNYHHSCIIILYMIFYDIYIIISYIVQ